MRGNLSEEKMKLWKFKLPAHLIKFTPGSIRESGEQARSEARQTLIDRTYRKLKG